MISSLLVNINSIGYPIYAWFNWCFVSTDLHDTYKQGKIQAYKVLYQITIKSFLKQNNGILITGPPIWPITEYLWNNDINIIEQKKVVNKISRKVKTFRSSVLRLKLFHKQHIQS